MTYLECPCCGDEGAESADGLFDDKQALLCGCPGHVVVDDDEDPPLARIWIDEDVDCPVCWRIDDAEVRRG